MGERPLALRHAFALGMLHGPTELLPISSSGHTTLVPWLAGWAYGELDPELRKSFEVALHAGTAAALLLRPPCSRPCSPDQGRALARVSARLGFLAVALTPPALTGYTLGGQIERRLGTPATIAAGLLAGSAAIAAVEMRSRGGLPTRACGASVFETPTHERYETGKRPAASADLRDGLALGLAQSLALVPGVSRSGATLAAARGRGFSRADADRLSWTVGLPVIAGAALLKGTRLARAGTPRALCMPLAAGAASAFLSTLASTTVLSAQRRARLLPVCVAYRTALALLVIRRMRDNTGEHDPNSQKIKSSHSPPASKGILRRSRLKS
jgi:undecaprenyl-diphosphatase